MLYCENGLDMAPGVDSDVVDLSILPVSAGGSGVTDLCIETMELVNLSICDLSKFDFSLAV